MFLLEQQQMFTPDQIPQYFLLMFTPDKFPQYLGLVYLFFTHTDMNKRMDKVNMIVD